MKLRAYVYKCARCGGFVEETELADNAKLIAESIENYTIPDEVELRRLKAKCKDSNVLLRKGHNEMTWHVCNDNGRGICRIVGCTPAYEEVF